MPILAQRFALPLHAACAEGTRYEQNVHCAASVASETTTITSAVTSSSSSVSELSSPEGSLATPQTPQTESTSAAGRLGSKSDIHDYFHTSSTVVGRFGWLCS